MSPRLQGCQTIHQAELCTIHLFPASHVAHRSSVPYDWHQRLQIFIWTRHDQPVWLTLVTYAAAPSVDPRRPQSV